jgi:hypothetical protein
MQTWTCFGKIITFISAFTIYIPRNPMSTFIIKSGVVLFLFAHHPRGSTSGARKRTESKQSTRRKTQQETASSWTNWEDYVIECGCFPKQDRLAKTDEDESQARGMMTKRL